MEALRAKTQLGILDDRESDGSKTKPGSPSVPTAPTSPPTTATTGTPSNPTPPSTNLPTPTSTGTPSPSPTPSAPTDASPPSAPPPSHRASKARHPERSVTRDAQSKDPEDVRPTLTVEPFPATNPDGLPFHGPIVKGWGIARGSARVFCSLLVLPEAGVPGQLAGWGGK